MPSHRFHSTLPHQKAILSCMLHSLVLGFTWGRTGRRLKKVGTRNGSCLQSLKLHAQKHVNTKQFVHSSHNKVEQSQWHGKSSKKSLKVYVVRALAISLTLFNLIVRAVNKLICIYMFWSVQFELYRNEPCLLPSFFLVIWWYAFLRNLIQVSVMCKSNLLSDKAILLDDFEKAFPAHLN